MRFAFQTLGCKVNQYETQAMEEILISRGHTLAPFDGQADVYIINSCTVTAVSDKKSRQTVRQARKRAPDALIALCGCYPQVSPEEAARLDADLIGGTGDRVRFLDLLEQLAEHRQKTVAVDNAFQRRVFEYLPAGGLEGRTRAMLKVEDGCVNFCSYCIIPYARGPIRSLPLADAVAEAQRLSRLGYRELVITGIEISSYGRDLTGTPTPADLIEAVCQAVPSMRIRLGSLEPRTVTEDFCVRLSHLPNLCPHFHLSMQSGCDETLQRMKRKYDTARYYESVELLRKHFDRPAITTDMIVGFPGETEAEFTATLDFIQKCAFTQMHIFPYSRRQGTPAAAMPGQLTTAEKAERGHRGADVARAMSQRWLSRWLDQTVEVLFEEEKDGFWRGYTPQYVEVRVTSDQDLHNQFRQVKLTALSGDQLFGVIEQEDV